MAFDCRLSETKSDMTPRNCPEACKINDRGRQDPEKPQRAIRLRPHVGATMRSSSISLSPNSAKMSKVDKSKLIKNEKVNFNDSEKLLSLGPLTWRQNRTEEER